MNKLNYPTLGDFIYQLISDKLKTLNGKEALELLFKIDTSIYFLEKKAAVLYGNGVHPKHRHTQYHNFFIERIPNGSTVLDIGCGNGAVAYDIAQEVGAQVLGIDLDSSNIQTAHDRFTHPRLQFFVGNALTDLPNKKYDYVILSNVLEHIQERVQFLIDLQKKISPNVILIRVPVFERDWRVPLKQELGLEWRLDTDHKIEYTLESFNEEMMAAKIQILHQEVRWGEIWAEVVPI